MSVSKKIKVGEGNIQLPWKTTLTLLKNSEAEYSFDKNHLDKNSIDYKHNKSNRSMDTKMNKNTTNNNALYWIFIVSSINFRNYR